MATFRTETKLIHLVTFQLSSMQVWFFHNFTHCLRIRLVADLNYRLRKTRLSSHLLVSLLVQQLPQIIQAGGDGALVGVRVLQVLVWDVGAGEEGSLGLVQPSQIHQDDPRVQVGGWR